MAPKKKGGQKGAKSSATKSRDILINHVFPKRMPHTPQEVAFQVPSSGGKAGLESRLCLNSGFTEEEIEELVPGNNNGPLNETLAALVKLPEVQAWLALRIFRKDSTAKDTSIRIDEKIIVDNLWKRRDGWSKDKLDSTFLKDADTPLIHSRAVFAIKQYIDTSTEAVAVDPNDATLTGLPKWHPDLDTWLQKCVIAHHVLKHLNKELGRSRHFACFPKQDQSLDHYLQKDSRGALLRKEVQKFQLDMKFNPDNVDKNVPQDDELDDDAAALDARKVNFTFLLADVQDVEIPLPEPSMKLRDFKRHVADIVKQLQGRDIELTSLTNMSYSDTAEDMPEGIARTSDLHHLLRHPELEDEVLIAAAINLSDDDDIAKGLLPPNAEYGARQIEVDRPIEDTNAMFEYVRDHLVTDQMMKDAKNPGYTTPSEETNNQAEIAPAATTDAAYQSALLAYEHMQKASSRVGTTYNNVRAAKDSLKRFVPGNHDIFMHNGQQDTADDPPKTETHKPHQIIFMAWAVEMLQRNGGGICADAMGMGKTHEIISLIQIATLFQRRVAGKVKGPTLIVVPGTLKGSWWETLTTELVQLFNDPEEWRLFQYGDGVQPGLNFASEKVAIERNAEWLSKPGAADHKVILITYEQLSRVSTDVRGIFHRIILDEAHTIRNAHKTRQGEVLMAMNAEERWCFTGTPAFNRIHDFLGLLFFLRRPRWYDKSDRNYWIDGGPTKNTAYRRYLEDPDNAAPPSADELAEMEMMEGDFVTSCDCVFDKVNGMPDEHFPSGLMKRRDSTASLSDIQRPPIPMTDADRTAANADPNNPGVKAQPFAHNPYTDYNEFNENRYRCFTPEAFSWWILAHAPDARKKGKKAGGNPDKLYTRMAVILKELVLGRNMYSMITDGDGTERAIRDGEPLAPKEMHIIRKNLNWASDEEAAAYETRAPKCKVKLKKSDEQYTIDRKETRMEGSEYTDMLQAKMDAVANAVDEKPNEDEDKESKKAARQTSYFQHIFALCSSQVLHGLRGAPLKLFRQEEICLPALVRMAYQNGRGGDPDGITEIPKDDFEVLRLALWGSPIFKAALADIYKVFQKPAGTRKKVLVYAQNPRTVAYFYRILAFIGVKTHLLTALSTPEERGEAFRAWNDPSDETQVMVGTYALKLAGLNGHRSCCTCLLLEPSYNTASEEQVYYRIRRWGQSEVQEVIRYHLRGTYMNWHMQNVVSKAQGISIALGHYFAAVELTGKTGTDYVAKLFGGTLGEQEIVNKTRRADRIP